MTQSTILGKVRKLLRVTEANGATPAEAAAMAAKAQELIDEYNLSTALLALDDTAPAPDEPIEDFAQRGAPLDDRHGRDRWRAGLAVVVAKANACRVYKNGPSIHLIGRATDAETVRYLYALIVAQVERLADTHGRGLGRTWRNNFALGCVETIAVRLRDQRAKFLEAHRDAAQQQSHAALVRVDRALVHIERRGADVDNWTRANMRLRSSGASRTTYNAGARAQGRAAGATVNLGSRQRGALTQ